MKTVEAEKLNLSPKVGRYGVTREALQKSGALFMRPDNGDALPLRDAVALAYNSVDAYPALLQTSGGGGGGGGGGGDGGGGR